MAGDMGLVRKKRQHPDGLHLTSSLPKRLLSISEGEIGSSVEDASISPGIATNTPYGSLFNSASSALINSDCSTSVRPACSSMFLDAASSKLESPGPVHSCLPSDAASSKLEGADRGHSRPPSNVASYDFGAFYNMRESLHQGDGKGVWMYRSDSTKHDGGEYEAEMSDVTFERHARPQPSGEELDRVSGSEKLTHVISRRDVSSSNIKDELWHKAALVYGDCTPRGKQWESSKLFGARQRRDHSFSSMACESASSCATEDSMVRPKQAFPYVYGSVCKESSTMRSRSHAKAEVLVEPRLQERIGCNNDNLIQRRQSSEAISYLSLAHNAASEEHSPSYVLSSGRMSLEEEAKLGRRAPTIDRDFEEYFSSLML